MQFRSGEWLYVYNPVFLWAELIPRLYALSAKSAVSGGSSSVIGKDEVVSVPFIIVNKSKYTGFGVSQPLIAKTV